MQKLVWQNSNGDVIDLTSGNYGITNWEGFSNADLNIQSQQVPFQDGAVFLDSLIDQRELSVTLAMQDSGNLEERYRMRRELIHALNPKLGEGYLIYTNDFISKRIECVAQIPLFETHNSNDSGTPKASLAWTACEPYWEDVEENVISTPINNHQINIENKGDVATEYKLNIVSEDLENLKFNDTEITGSIPALVEASNETGNKHINSQSLQKSLKGIVAEIYCNCPLDDERFCLGSKSSIVIYNVIKKEVENIISFSGEKYVADIQKINDVYYALVNPIECVKNFSRVTTCGESYIYTSTNGINWQLKHTFTSNVLLKKIKYFNNNFYILNKIGIELLSSTDLESFTQVYENEYYNGYDFLIEDNLLIIVGGDNSDINNWVSIFATSTDFENFTTVSKEGVFGLSIVKYQNKYIIGCSKYEWSSIPFEPVNFYYSSNGTTWTAKYFPELRGLATLGMVVNGDYLSLLAIAYTGVNPSTTTYNNRIINLFDTLSIASIFNNVIKYGYTISQEYVFGDCVYTYNIFGAEKQYTFNNYDFGTPFDIIKLPDDNWLFLYKISNGISYKYGKLSNLSSGTNTSIKRDNISIIFSIGDYVYIKANQFYKFNGTSFISFQPQGIEGTINAVTKDNDVIYIYTEKYISGVNTYFIYKTDLNFNILDVWTKERTDDPTFSLLFIINNKFIAYSRSGFLHEMYYYGSHAEIIFDDQNKTFRYSNIYHNSSYFSQYKNNTGRSQQFYNKINNIYYLCLDTDSKLYYSTNCLNWVPLEISDSVENIIEYEGLTFLICQNSIYMSTDGINFDLYTSGNFTNLSNEEKNLYGFDELGNEYLLTMKEKDNIISQIKNQFFKSLDVGNNVIDIFRTSGSGSIKISYRQKYIGV